MKRLAIFFLTVLAAGSSAAEQARSVSRAVEVPGVWTAEQHLYVKGNVLPAGPLGDLEAWLDANAANWTVVLTEHAADEMFTDAAGERFAGMKAVEHALGKSLPAVTGFGALKHPQTGERSGAFLVIFLRERKFSYSGADVYDRRGLGEKNFTGNLDAPAIQAMRGGGRVADAVKDTVNFIDGELSRRLAGEAEERRRAEERIRRAREETAATIAALRGRLTEAVAAMQEIRRGYPAARGGLLTPSTELWSRQLDAAEASLAAGRNDEAATAVRAVEEPLGTHLRLLADHARGPEQIAAQQRETDALRLHEQSARAQAALLESRSALKRAAAAHADADASWSAALGDAARLLRSAAVADAETKRETDELARIAARAAALSLPAGSRKAAAAMADASAALEEAKREFASGETAGRALRKASDFLTKAEQEAAAWEREQLAGRRARQAGGIVAGSLALVAGIVGNRRRRRVRDQARTLLEAWEKTFREKTDGLFKLMDRTRTSVGSSEILERSGWTGETADIARRTIRDVDQLFVMSSAIDGVLEKARALVLPRNPLGSAVNFVARKRYDDAVQLLNEDRIAFGPEDPLRPVLQSVPDIGTSEWRGLLGKKEECESFSMTFDELIAAFNDRAARALQCLDRIDTGWLRISDERQKLDAALDQIEADEQQLHGAAVKDRLFVLEPLFDALLPSARKDEADANNMAAKDPVQAMEGPLAVGARKAADARTLCGAVQKARAGSLPVIRQAVESLQKSGRRTVWVDEALNELSGKAGAVARAAVEEAQTSPIEALAAELNSQELRVCAAVDLMERAAESCLPEIEKTEEAVREARVQLGNELGIPPENILCEDEAKNPTVKLTAARAQHAASLAEIDRGDTSGAGEALNACDACCHAAAALIAETRAAFAAWPANAQRIAAETVRLSESIPRHAEQLRLMESSWAASALVSAAGDPLSNNIRDAETCLEQARRQTASAAEQRAAGRILTAAAGHRSAEELNVQAASQLDEIGTHAEKLRQAAAANRVLALELAAWRQRLTSVAGEPSAMRRSVDRMQEISAATECAEAAANADGPAADPFRAAEALQTCRTSMQELEQQLKADAELHNDTARSAQEAERQLSSLGQLAVRSQQDQIPDSQAISRILQELPGMEQALRRCRDRLSQPHEDWPQIDAAVDEIATESARLRGILSGELQLAEQSTATLQRAAATIRSLHGWRGPFGISVDSTAGQRDFDAAREALRRGEYAEATRLGDRSRSAAQRALTAAEDEERRQKREQERREEAARRAAEQRAAAAQGAGRSPAESFGGFSSARDSSPSVSSSGTASSGFSSDSGTARSGW